MPLKYRYTEEYSNTRPAYARVRWKPINSKNELNSNSNSNSNEDGLDHYYDDELSGDFEVQNENENNRDRQSHNINPKDFWEINLNVTKGKIIFYHFFPLFCQHFFLLRTLEIANE